MINASSSVTATTRSDGGAVLILRGTIDATRAREAEALIRDSSGQPGSTLVIDISGADELTGALLGLLVRATRKLAWRNRRLVILCTQPELRRRLDMAGMDDLADVVGAWPEGES
jgi:anti-sigma B factor antagonist